MCPQRLQERFAEGEMSLARPEGRKETPQGCLCIRDTFHNKPTDVPQTQSMDNRATPSRNPRNQRLRCHPPCCRPSAPQRLCAIHLPATLHSRFAIDSSFRFRPSDFGRYELPSKPSSPPPPFRPEWVGRGRSVLRPADPNEAADLPTAHPPSSRARRQRRLNRPRTPETGTTRTDHPCYRPPSPLISRKFRPPRASDTVVARSAAGTSPPRFPPAKDDAMPRHAPTVLAVAMLWLVSRHSDSAGASVPISVIARQ